MACDGCLKRAKGSSTMPREEVDNSSFTLRRLYQLYCNEELSDLQIKVGSRHYSAHKLVLCMSSDVFRTMLTGNTWPESNSKRIVLQEDNECADVFEDFLRYLYNGHVWLENSTVLPILTLADKYNVSDLSEACLAYMCRHCLPGSCGYVMSWLQYAIMCGHSQLENICRIYIMYNFEFVMKTREFLNLNLSSLLTFLKSSDLVISEEFTLYHTIKKWLEANFSDDTEQNKSLFHKVFCHIRFPMMQLRQLATLESDPFVHDYKDFYMRRIFSAMKFHTATSPAARQELVDSSSNRIHFYPRNYTNESWSTVITVDDIYSLAHGEVRGAFFTTPASCSEVDHHNILDWHLHLYPKGIRFDSCIMIGVPSNQRVDGDFFPNVRLSVSTACEKTVRVEICVLIMASASGGMEYVHTAVNQKATFDKDRPLINMDDIVPYHQLVSGFSPYVDENDVFKIVITIRPDSV